MKKIYNKAKPHRYFRRLVPQWFSRLINHQNCNCQFEIEKVTDMLQDIEVSIEIIARQVARWVNLDDQ
jgi:hypothetical protein